MNRKIGAVLYHIALAALGAAVGAASGAVCGVFGAGLNAIVPFARGNFDTLVWFLPLAGGVTAVMFRLWGNKKQGMSYVLRSARGEGSVPLRNVAFQFVGTWSAHLFCASVGREGAAMQIGAAVGGGAGNLFSRPLSRLGGKDAARVLTVAGMAAGFSALFMTPLAAFCFALEVTFAGKVGFRAVLPSLTAAFAGFFVSGLIGTRAHTYVLPEIPVFDWLLVAKSAGLGVLFGLCGLFFSFALRAMRALFARAAKNSVFRAAAGGVLLACLLFLAYNGRYSGLGADLVDAAFGGEQVYAWDWAVKILFTAATLGAGFIGGEVTTMFAAGSLLGAALSDAFSVPPELAVCLGYAAVFASSTGTLIAPVLIGGEIFGFEAAPYLIAACLFSYVFSFGFSVYGRKSFLGKPLPPLVLRGKKKRFPYTPMKKLY